MTLPATNHTSSPTADQRDGGPLFSVIVPSLGGAGRLNATLDALAAQTLPAARREILIVLDGAKADDGIRARAAALGAKLIELNPRGGPGAARNAAAAEATGEWLAFTEDDCTPAPDWLERAAARIEREPGLDVLEGRTVKPGGARVHRHAGEHPLYLPTNLFVRRSTFLNAGGYHTGYFDAARGIYFREDSDLGFTLEAQGARIAREPLAVVEHPVEHTGFLDPLRWARRYEMDALLEARHPERFRDRIEVHRVGPFVIRRPIVRASILYVLALMLAGATWAGGLPGTAAWFAGFALLMLLVVWAKWRFDPLRLPVCLIVPFVLVTASLRGRGRRTGPDHSP
jgi:glycosyltransferase involved in cell wall biosynthesis